MSQPSHLRLAPKTVGASGPGGAARQFRVQCFSRKEAAWRMFATFSHSENAEQCLDNLQEQGYQARVVQYQLPAAA